jgi:hypothetical protein
MAATRTTNNTTQRKAAPRTTRTSRTDAARIREGLTKVRNGSVSYVRQTAERSVDVPVGAVLAVPIASTTPSSRSRSARPPSAS